MRKLYLLLAWLSLSASAISQNLVAYYPFNGNANDETGNGNNSSYIGTGVTLTTDRFGNANKAYYFDGAAGSYIRIPADNFPATNRTISFWFNADDPAVYRVPFSYGGNGCDASCFLMILNQSGTGTYTKTGHCNAERLIVPYSTPPVNSWKQWVITINGTLQKIYIDGVLQTPSFDANFSTPTYVAGRFVLLGAMVNTDGNTVYQDGVWNFKGKLDEFRIYNNAMTDAQVAAEYSGMVAYYPFNGNANDATGNNHNGTVSGATLTTDRFGNTNNAYSFNGSSNYIDINQASNLNLPEYTYSAWIYSTANPAGISPQTAMTTILDIGDITADQYMIIFNHNGNSGIAGSGYYAGGGTYNLVTGTLPNLNQWYHVTITRSTTTFKLFVNGQLSQTMPLSTAGPSYGISPAGLIGKRFGNQYYFSGKIDEVRIYDNPLSDAQVLQLYNNESTGLVAYFPFNGNANDATGNNHNGTVSGATLTTDRTGNASSAYVFNGSSDFIQINEASSLTLPQYTYSAWVNLNAYPPGNNVQTGAGTILDIGNISVDQYIYIVNYNPYYGFSGSGYYTGGGAYDIRTGVLPNLNQWYHVAVTRSTTEAKLYVNGILIQTLPLAAAGPDYGISPGGLIGKRFTDIQYFNGKIDEVRIYNRTLSPNEIQQLADVPMMPDLVAYLPMNGNANDMSGNGRNGTPYGGAVLTTDKYDNTNSAYSFDGIDDGISLANTSTLDFIGTPFTLSAWVKYSNIAGPPVVIVGKHNCGTASGYFLGVENNVLKFWMASGSSWNILQTPESYNDNKWHHVVGTYDGTSQTFYVDGVFKSGTSVVYSTPASGASVIIGDKTGSCSGGIFNGSIDEVKIYGAAIDDAQVMALYKQSRGSGKAMKFDGVDDFVSIPNGGALNNLQTGTIDLWVKWNGTNQDPGADGAFGAIVARQSDVLFSNQVIALNGQDPNSAKITWMPYSSTSTVITSTFSPGNRWNHLAIVYSSGNHEMYLNGILVGASGELGTIQNATVPLTFGGWIGDGSCFGNVELDEVRIWNTALSETQIRNWMNRKITPDHPAFSNLVGYYTFDEQNLLQAYDSRGTKTGNLVNGPVCVTSGAAIGDGSSNDFINVTKSANITLPTGENFASTETSGTPGGISVFVVKDPPENQTGILGIGSNDHYFGVHVSGGSSPQYSAVYNYTGNPFVSPATEPTLQLFKRNDNSTAAWTNSGATLSTAANTLTVTGQNTEYILGSSGFGLPVTLLSFQAQKINATTAKLTWQTATELNNKGFEVHRSFDGNYFVNVGFVNGAGNSDMLKEYSTTDIPGKTGRVYYRLKQVDFDGNSKLSQIVSIVFDKQGLIKVYPNPAQQQVVIEGVDQYSRIHLLDAAGKLIKEQLNNGQYLLTLNLDGLKSGMYLLRLSNGNDNQTIKLMIEN